MGVRLSEEQIQKRDRALHALHDHRVRQAAAKEDERNRAHEKRCAKTIGELESAIAEIEAERTRLLERHRQERAEVDGRLDVQRSKLSGLITALAPGETSEQRRGVV